MYQNIFGETLQFSMRTFRFTSEESVENTQTQTFECDIHLEPIGDILEEQARDCTCYEKVQCQSKLHLLFTIILKEVKNIR